MSECFLRPKYRSGDKVYNAAFGAGVIISTEKMRKQQSEVTVNFGGSLNKVPMNPACLSRISISLVKNV